MRLRTFLALVLLLSGSSVAMARNTIVNISMKSVLDMPEAKEKLHAGIHFYLMGQPTPQVAGRFATVVTNRKTNNANKSDVRGCMWAALSALISLQDAVEAQGQGANAVVDIVSYYQKNVRESATDFECHAGAIIAGVALRGTVAKVDQ